MTERFIPWRHVSLRLDIPIAAASDRLRLALAAYAESSARAALGSGFAGHERPGTVRIDPD
jgi:hypothetical protein